MKQLTIKPTKHFLYFIIILVFFIHINQSFSQGEWKYKGYKEGLRDNFITKICEDGNNNIWMLTGIGSPFTPGFFDLNQGLRFERKVQTKLAGVPGYFYKYSRIPKGHIVQYTTNNTWNNFENNKYLKKRRVFSLMSRENGNIYTVYTPSHHNQSSICLYNSRDDNWTIVNRKYLKDNFNAKRKGIFNFTIDSHDRIWIKRYQLGLILCENNTNREYLSKTTDITYSNDGYLITEDGIYLFSNNDFIKIRDVNKKFDYDYKGIDPDKNAWFYIKDGNNLVKIAFFNGEIWQDYEAYLKIKNQTSFNKLYFSKNNKVYAKFDHDIICIDRDSLYFINFESPDIPKNYIFDKIVFDNENSLFISCISDIKSFGASSRFTTESGMIIKWDGTKFKYYKENENIEKSRHLFIRDILVDNKNYLWVITGSPSTQTDIYTGKKTAKIIRIKDDEWEVFDDKDFNAKAYTQIFQDSKGRIWIGSEDDGIFMYEYTK